MKNLNKMEDKSIVFKWKAEDFNLLLNSCEDDDEVKYTLQFLKDKNATILEAGCGLGRVVKYLSDLNYKNVYGIEIDKESVNFLNNSYPELNIICGDILEMPYSERFFDVVLSYGVIEHFFEGPLAPMQAMFNVLRSGGIAIVTIPSFNYLRKINYYLNYLDLRKYNFIRKIFNKPLLNKNRKRFKYLIDPQYGNFFEYRFSPKQFEKICRNTGFKVVKSIPIAHVDGLFHSFGSPLVTFSDWKFKVSRFGNFVNNTLRKIPFFHNHMHMCILKKL